MSDKRFTSDQLHTACRIFADSTQDQKQQLRKAVDAGLLQVRPDDFFDDDLRRRWYLVTFALTRGTFSPTTAARSIDFLEEEAVEQLETEIQDICRTFDAQVFGSSKH